MESIHVPASVVQRIASVVKWLAPALLTGLLGLLGFFSSWILDRASTTFVADTIAAEHIPKIAADAHHASTLADEHTRELAILFEHLVAVEAELVVYRQYSKLAADPNRRGRLIEQAQQFYSTEFDAQLAKHEPIEALRRTMRVGWEPKQP